MAPFVHRQMTDGQLLSIWWRNQPCSLGGNLAGEGRGVRIPTTASVAPMCGNKDRDFQTPIASTRSQNRDQ